MKLSKRVPSNIAGAIKEEIPFRHESDATLFKNGAPPFLNLARNSLIGGGMGYNGRGRKELKNGGEEEFESQNLYH